MFTSGVSAYFFLYHTAKNIEASRKRDADAQVIAIELEAYAQRHDNNLPASLSEISLTYGDVDLLPFSFYPNGSKSGQRQIDVVVEADSLSGKNIKIRIYRDWEVTWEE